MLLIPAKFTDFFLLQRHAIMNKRPAAVSVAFHGDRERAASLGQAAEYAARAALGYAHAFGKLRAGKYIAAAGTYERVDARDKRGRYAIAGWNIHRTPGIERVRRGAAR